MLLFIILFQSFFTSSLLQDEGCCFLEIVRPDSKGEKKLTFDLNPLSDTYFGTEVATYKGHMVTARFCKNLEGAHTCVNPTTTSGPRPFKDEYNAFVGSCWYVGGLEGCYIGDYDPGPETIMISYPGVADPSGQIRSTNITVHCDPGSAIDRFSCDDVQSQGSTHTYTCDLFSKYGCPSIEHEYFCYGKSSWDDSVCTSHGKCVSDDVCECEKYWHGKECEKYVSSSSGKYAGWGVAVGVLSTVVLCLFVAGIIGLLVCVRKRASATASKKSSHYSKMEDSSHSQSQQREDREASLDTLSTVGGRMEGPNKNRNRQQRHPDLDLLKESTATAPDYEAVQEPLQVQDDESEYRYDASPSAAAVQYVQQPFRNVDQVIVY